MTGGSLFAMVGDATEDVDAAELLADLAVKACRAHRLQVAEHELGTMGRCTWSGFAGEPCELSDGGLIAMVQAMIRMEADDRTIERTVDLWYESGRPFGILHGIPVE